MPQFFTTNKSKFLLLFVFLQNAGILFAQSTFTPGNVVVYRIGPKTIGASYERVFLDEYTPSGSLVQSIALPPNTDGASLPLTSLRSEPGMGALCLSADKKYLSLTGYSAQEMVNCNACRVTIGIIDYNGNVNTTTSYPFSGNRPGPAITSNGTDIWVGTSLLNTPGSIRYLTTGSSTGGTILYAPTGSHSLIINEGQLYASYNGQNATITGYIARVGIGLPTTTGQTINKLQGIPNDIRPNQFVLVDLDPTIAGPDVLYFANGNLPNSTTPLTDGILKYSFNGTFWQFKGSVGIAGDNYRGLTGTVAGNKVTLFGTRKVTQTGNGGELISLVDSSGHDGTLSGIPTILVTATTGATFRGVALAPTPPPCSSVTGLTASNITSNSADISWNDDAGSTSYQYVISTSNIPPASGTDSSGTSFHEIGLLPVTNYYVHVRNRCGTIFSPWVTSSFKTSCPAPVPTIVFANFAAGKTEIRWNKISGVTNYEYAILTHAAPSVGSTSITPDTSLFIDHLKSGNKYYLHIRSHCGETGISSWSTIEFHPAGVQVYPNPGRDKVFVRAYGVTNHNGRITLSDATGRILKKITSTGNMIEIDITGLAGGVYYIRFENEKGFTTTLIKL